MKESGFDFALNPFMNGIKFFESDEGILLNISNRPGFRIHGKIIAFCADTKGDPHIKITLILTRRFRQHKSVYRIDTYLEIENNA